MIAKRKYSRHYEESAFISASCEDIFAYEDNPMNFSSHMNKSSWMMGGGSMKTQVDEGKGKTIDSHIKMVGNVFGITLFLDEIVIEHTSPYRKVWETVGKLNLLVIDHYKLGFIIESENDKSKLTVFIDYNPPQSTKTYLLGVLFSGLYAQWCVRQMIQGVKDHFTQK